MSPIALQGLPDAKIQPTDSKQVIVRGAMAPPAIPKSLKYSQHAVVTRRVREHGY
jgi:hypothetical protein